MENSNLNWFTVDEASMKGEAAKTLAALRKAQKAASAAKTEFEAAFSKAAHEGGQLATGDSLMFSYRFGKLSVAKATEPPKPKAAAKPKFSF